MLSEYEAQKLQHDMKQELEASTGVVYKCAVGLLILLGLAWIGADTGPRQDVAPDAPQAQHRESALLAHGKKPYDERQARIESPQDQSEMARR